MISFSDLLFLLEKKIILLYYSQVSIYWCTTFQFWHCTTNIVPMEHILKTNSLKIDDNRKKSSSRRGVN